MSSSRPGRSPRPALAEAIGRLTGEGALAFFDAIAPIVHRHSIDMDVAWMQSRYDKAGPGGDAAAYVNCPMTRDQYEAFIDALLAAEKTEFREFEGTPYFDGCLPIEVMAERGRETLRHGPMKPVGLTNAHDPKVKPYAVVQLRQDNALGTLFNMVGFQTKLKYGEQGRMFRMIPGLERPNSRGSAACTATPISIRRACSTRACASRPRRDCASPARSPAAKAMSRAPRSASSPAVSPPPSARGAPLDPAADHGDRRAAQSHHRRPYRIDRRRPALIPADERQFRPVPPDRRAASRRERASACTGPSAASPASARCPRGRSRIWRDGRRRRVGRRQSRRLRSKETYARACGSSVLRRLLSFFCNARRMRHPRATLNSSNQRGWQALIGRPLRFATKKALRMTPRGPESGARATK